MAKNKDEFLKCFAEARGNITVACAAADIANQIPEMKEVLTNVAIDINAPQNAKQSENR